MEAGAAGKNGLKKDRSVLGSFEYSINHNKPYFSLNTFFFFLTFLFSGFERTNKNMQSFPRVDDVDWTDVPRVIVDTRKKVRVIKNGDVIHHELSSRMYSVTPVQPSSCSPLEQRCHPRGALLG